ncbi:MAG: pseudouridine synthase, partial [Thermoplasmata archaeon]
PRFVVDIDPELRPGDEVIVVDKDDNPLALGRLLLSPREVGEMKSGVAVKVREGVKSRER